MTKNCRNRQLGSQAVRLFYRLVLMHIIPRNPTVSKGAKKSGALSDEQWEKEFCESLSLELDRQLGPYGFQVAYNKKIGVCMSKDQQLTCFIPFLVSKVHEFKAEDIIVPNVGFSGFKVKDKALLLVRKTLEQDIVDALCEKVAIHEISFSMATARDFVFEVYYAGSFRVKHEFSDDEIGGGVRDALEWFFEEIRSAILPYGVDVTDTPSTHRRSRNNEYLFHILYSSYLGFGEDEVFGRGCYALMGDASLDEINLHGVDFDDLRVDEIGEYLYSIIEGNLPSNTVLISSKINYVDDPEAVFDVCDELICSEL